MKTFVSTSCMFPVSIFCFNEGIFHSDVIQHVLMVGILTNDTIYTVLLQIRRSLAGSSIVLRRQKTYLFFSKFFLGYEKIFWMKSVLLKSILFLNAKHPVQKLFLEFLNLETPQMGNW